MGWPNRCLCNVQGIFQLCLYYKLPVWFLWTPASEVKFTVGSRATRSWGNRWRQNLELIDPSDQCLLLQLPWCHHVRSTLMPGSKAKMPEVISSWSWGLIFFLEVLCWGWEKWFSSCLWKEGFFPSNVSLLMPKYMETWKLQSIFVVSYIEEFSCKPSTWLPSIKKSEVMLDHKSRACSKQGFNIRYWLVHEHTLEGKLW